jgi:catechol 2,3-dioxygenase-like lactoylglutathione lyase family enzyme
MLSHIELNVTDLEASTRFYLRALQPLGFGVADRGEGYVRLTNGKDAVVVLCPVAQEHRHRTHHRKGVGLGHFALTVDSPAALDAFGAHLAAQGIALLGEGKLHTEYRRGYSTLAFEDPDRVMVEVVYADPYYYSFEPA